MTEAKRLDKALVEQGLAATRSQAENYIGLGKVRLNGRVATKSGLLVKPGDQIELMIQPEDRYVGRAAMKLASVAEVLKIDFRNKLVLDVGSSTGGFTEFALKSGASKVVAVDVGSDQLHPSLRSDARVELHEKTDIRSFKMAIKPDLVVADLSFISLRDVLPSIGALSEDDTQIIVLLKPQFEAGKSQINKGVVKNETLRRQIIKDFEAWAKQGFVIAAKADSDVAGAHGNRERFYSLRKLSKGKLPKPARRAK
jgi:23S rRNA (cytidine1920-2'-O)/16S rRNA (cytidine1409-2'-O)-methyltransferase